MDLCSLIDRNAAFAPDKTAIAFEGERLSYGALAARVERTATALKQELGVGRGDRVAILSLNRPDYLVLLYACARLGAILVPLNWRLAVAEQRFILTDAGAKVLVLEQAFAGVLPELAPGTAVIGMTSRHLVARYSRRCWLAAKAAAAIRTLISPARF